MVEQPKFKGLFVCPDYRTPINENEPFQYKCKGMHLTEHGTMLLDAALQQQHDLRESRN